MGEVDKKQHILPLDQPVALLESTAAFEGLSSKEKLYTHFLSQASWAGGLITLLQTSPESGPLFVFLHKLFIAQSPPVFRTAAVKAGFTEDEVTALLVFATGVFSNSGNYKGFGDSKFIPGIECERLEELLKVSPIWAPQLESLWNEIKGPIYDLAPGKTCLGYQPHGCSTYFSKNFSPEDNEKVKQWLKKKDLECYNTRCMKIEDNNKITYEIRLAGKEYGELIKEEIDGVTYKVVKGDYGKLMGRVAACLKDAIPHAANKVESDMLEAYVRSFTSGSLQEHKDGSRFWIKDKGPAVETYIGFIETYRDPAGMRGEFEGFVAVVNRDMSKKFTKLVESAETFLPLLPWPKGFEKDTFLRPDFTSLDVVTFAGSGIPAGINIPNYDEIRQTEGFKNVSLGNVIPASYSIPNPTTAGALPFLSDSDRVLLHNNRVQSFELQVGLHELLGHGSGKLLYRDANGESPNYPAGLLDPLTGAPPSTWYETGDTYDSKFGAMGSSYEECRAEAVGLYLSLESRVLEVFGYGITTQEERDKAEAVTYVNWLSLVWAGLCALELWDPRKGWLQAHAQARYVLMRVLIQAGVVTITEPSPTDLLLTLDPTAYRGAGRHAISHFLLQLQVHKATGDVATASALYDRYSAVTDDGKGENWVSRRDVVIAHKRPRKMFTQPNTVRSVENEVRMNVYEGTTEGLIASWVERFGAGRNVEELHEEVLELAKRDTHHFV